MRDTFHRGVLMTDKIENRWRPIAEAPKDESWLLLLFPDDAADPEPRVRSGFWSIEHQDWYDSEAAGNSLTELMGCPPTDWAPIPTLPWM
jgi:hypothetical protein